MSGMIFILGLMIGSFLNVCIYRIPQGMSVAYPGSHCPVCQHGLGALDLIPVLSYLGLGGKCRYCKTKYSIRYSLVELLTGALFLMTYWQNDNIYDLVKYLILTCYLVVVAFIDLDHMEIYDKVNGLAAIAGVAFLFRGDVMDNFVSYGLGALIGLAIIGLIILVTHGAMGSGDMILLGVVGLYIGYEYIFLCFVLSTIIASLISLGLIAFKVKNRKDYIPFGPFIAIAAWICALWGEQIWGTYLQWLAKGF